MARRPTSWCAGTGGEATWPPRIPDLSNSRRTCADLRRTPKWSLSLVCRQRRSGRVQTQRRRPCIPALFGGSAAYVGPRASAVRRPYGRHATEQRVWGTVSRPARLRGMRGGPSRWSVSSRGRRGFHSQQTPGRFGPFDLIMIGCAATRSLSLRTFPSYLPVC